jgi:hypothetical protein
VTYITTCMTFTRAFKRKNKDGTIKTYYAEVKSVRINGKVVQKYIRPLGADPKHPTNIPLDSVHFSYLALRLMQDALTANDLFEMLETMGQPVIKEELERIGINYNFQKKRTLSPYFTGRNKNQKEKPMFDMPKNSKNSDNIQPKHNNTIW